jgi:DNA-binding response OmpR family regulator
MGKKILVVDDEPLIRSTIDRALSKVGYEVTTTPDAESFLDVLTIQDADLLIIDIHLGSYSNEELLKKAGEISPRSKVLLISGSFLRAEDDNFLEKPFKLDELRAKVKEILGE